MLFKHFLSLKISMCTNLLAEVRSVTTKAETKKQKNKKQNKSNWYVVGKVSATYCASLISVRNTKHGLEQNYFLVHITMTQASPTKTRQCLSKMPTALQREPLPQYWPHQPC